jgi:hypothetical protein
MGEILMAAKDVTSNYSLFSERGLEGHVASLLPGAYFFGTSEGLFNNDETPLPFGRVVTYQGVDGGVGLPSDADQDVAGVTFYQAQFEASSQFGGDAGIPSEYPVTLAKRNVIVLMVPETNISKGSPLYFRHTANGTPGANEALGRIRANADTAKADLLTGVRLIEDAVAGTPCKVELINVGG